MYVCTHVLVCMYVCMYVCIHTYEYIHYIYLASLSQQGGDGLVIPSDVATTESPGVYIYVLPGQSKWTADCWIHNGCMSF